MQGSLKQSSTIFNLQWVLSNYFLFSNSELVHLATNVKIVKPISMNGKQQTVITGNVRMEPIRSLVIVIKVTTEQRYLL